MGASGVGALIAAVLLALRKSVRGLGRIIPISAALFGVGLIGFSFSRILWISLLLMVVTGAGMMQQMAASNTILQTIVDDDKRGRVMSFYAMAFMGMTPFGSLLAGIAANHIGAPYTLGIGGVFCIVGAAWFVFHLPAIRDGIRPIYRRLGIIPQVAAALPVPPED
jgi:MFS family permease